MPESFLGDGLIFEESLPVVWTPGILAEGAQPARLHALQRLEYKVNILLRLTAELALRSSGLPAAEKVRMSSRALEWFGEHSARTEAPGLLSVYINSALPQPLKIPSIVAGMGNVDGASATRFRFVGLSDAVVDMLE